MKGIIQMAATGLAVAVACLALGACSGKDHGGGTASAPAGKSPLEGKVNVLAMILSAGGQPVENALMGGGDSVSTGDGVIAGTVTPPDSGWVRVTADGYATGYMKRSGKPLHGWYIFETHLTPIGSAAVFDRGKGALLVAGEAAAPQVTVLAGPEAFSATDVIVDMAVVRPTDMGPEFAPLSDGSGLYLNEGLFVSAHDAAGKAAALAAGRNLQATIRDGGRLGRKFALARFDAQTGQWAVQAGACRRSDDHHLQCSLPRAGLYGLFGGSAPAAGTGNAYRDARHAYSKALGDWLRKTGGRGVADGAKAPSAVREAGLALVKAARDYGIAHHDERGQMHLISTAAEIRMIGMPVVGRDLIDDARKYVKAAAGTLLGQATDCARIRTLLDTAAKADLLGMDQTRHDLIFKARNSYGACDVWAGTVHYTFFMARRWPGDSDYRRRAGPQIWNEEHRVKILVSPMSRKTHGVDRVRIDMPQVVYRRDFKNECGGKNFAQRGVYAVPQDATMRLKFDGLFDYVHDRFQLSAFKPEASGTLPRIVLHRRSRVRKAAGPGCRPTSAQTTSVLVKDYASVLAGAFAGASAGPSVQEMLNEGKRSKLGNGRVVQGGRLIDIDPPKDGLPFTRARVSWHLINVPPNP